MITYQIVKGLFNYEPDSGISTWKIKPSRAVNAGDIAGSINSKGYLHTRISGKVYFNHRISFLWYHGYLPKYVDHKDTIPLHNWISNLRECSHSQNNFNIKISKNNKSGVKGVCWNKSAKKWHAQLQVNRKSIHLGLFVDLKEAEKTIKAARLELHGEFTNHGKSE